MFQAFRQGLRFMLLPCMPALLVLLMLVMTCGPARALPSLAAQTGQPCTACHVGSFGPELTPFGRAFKIGGYTLGGGQGWQSKVPVSLMALSSFNRTQANVPADQVAHHYANNNNFSIDQASLFLAGRVTDHTGGFLQLTYSPVDNTSAVDNADLRPYTTVIDLGDRELRVGISLNNSPTVQDPYNSTFAWGYPYVMSAIAPSPTAQPILAGAFAGNTLGYTAYAWYDSRIYLEAGAYNSLSPWTLSRFGNDYGVGSTTSPAPYLRAAYEWNWNGQSAHVGALFMHADVSPPTGSPFQTNASMGNDHYTDYAIDAGYQFLGDGTHTVTVQGIATHEEQNLTATTALSNAANGTSFGSHYNLNQVRANMSYWYQNTYGATLGWQGTWGGGNPVLYQPAELTGSNNTKPTSNAFIAEADWVPFGHDGSWMAPWANLKLGLQYIAYTSFNGSGSNYDGFHRSAANNNTIFAFVWMAY